MLPCVYDIPLFEASVFSLVEKTKIAIADHGVTLGIKRHNTNKMFNAVPFGDYATQRLAICQEAGSHMNTTTSQQDDGEGTSVPLNWFAQECRQWRSDKKYIWC